MALALAGDGAKANHMADELVRQYPDATLIKFLYLPMIRAAGDLNARSTSSGTQAVQSLEATQPYELGSPSSILGLSLLAAYIRGLAYLTAGQGREAATEFQKLLDKPYVVANMPYAAFSHLGVARAYALSGDKVKARTAYQDFLALWKDADADLPILQQAKAEYAKLQ